MREEKSQREDKRRRREMWEGEEERSEEGAGEEGGGEDEGGASGEGAHEVGQVLADEEVKVIESQEGFATARGDGLGSSGSSGPCQQLSLTLLLSLADHQGNMLHRG